MAAAYLTEFYRQLHLLTQSSLPLPESLRQLADNARRPEFRRVLADLAEQTAQGRPLAAAMAAHPNQFDPSFVRMIAAAESAGTLPETLAEIAGLAAVHGQLIAKTREITIYPLFTIFFAMLVLFGMFGFIVPEFQLIFNELLEGAPLPWLTAQAVGFSSFVAAWGSYIMGAYILALGYFIWLFSGMAGANRQLLGLIRRIPLAKDVFRQLQTAQACSLWSVLMKLKMPLSEALTTVAELVDAPPLSAAFQRLAEQARQGSPLADAMAKERAIPSLLLVAVRHAAEADLPGELDVIAGLFRDRASAATSRAIVAWEIVLIFVVGVIVGMTVVALFLPLVWCGSGGLGA
jgi:type II secretory pathway component PulF